MALGCLTSKATQWMQIYPTTTVPISPLSSPACLKAIGMARMPDPREPLSKCNKAPVVLCRKDIYFFKYITNKFKIWILYFSSYLK